VYFSLGFGILGISSKVRDDAVLSGDRKMQSGDGKKRGEGRGERENIIRACYFLKEFKSKKNTTERNKTCSTRLEYSRIMILVVAVGAPSAFCLLLPLFSPFARSFSHKNLLALTLRISPRFGRARSPHLHLLHPYLQPCGELGAWSVLIQACAH
jgi:hypothetical protein